MEILQIVLLLAVGTGIQVSSAPSDSNECYGALAFLTNDTFETYPLVPLVFPKLSDSIVIADLDDFTDESGLVYDDATGNYLHINRAGDLKRGTAKIMSDFKSKIATVVADNPTKNLYDIIGTDTGIYIRDDNETQLFYWADGATSFIDFSDGSLDILFKTDATEASDCLNTTITKSENLIRYQDGECWYSLQEAQFEVPAYEESTQVFYTATFTAGDLISISALPVDTDNMIVNGNGFWYRFSGGYPKKWELSGSHTRYQFKLVDFIGSEQNGSLKFLADQIELYDGSGELLQSITPLATDPSTLNPFIQKTILFNTGTDIDTCETFQNPNKIDTGIPSDDPNCWGELLTTVDNNIPAEIPVFPNNKLTSFVNSNRLIVGDVLELNDGYTLLIDDGVLYGYKQGQSRVAFTDPNVSGSSFTFDNYPRLLNGITQVWPTDTIGPEYFDQISDKSLQVDTSTSTPFLTLGDGVVDLKVNGTVDINVQPSDATPGLIYLGTPSDAATCKTLVDNEFNYSSTDDDYFSWNANGNSECYLASNFTDEVLPTSVSVKLQPQVFPTKTYIDKFATGSVWTTGTQLVNNTTTMLFNEDTGQILIYIGDTLRLETPAQDEAKKPYVLSVSKSDGLTITYTDNEGKSIDTLNKPTNNVNVRFLELDVTEKTSGFDVILATKNYINDLMIQSVFGQPTTNGNYQETDQVLLPNKLPIYLGEIEAGFTIEDCEDRAQHQGLNQWSIETSNNTQYCFAGTTLNTKSLDYLPEVFPQNLFLELTDGQEMTIGDQLESQDGNVVAVLRDTTFTVWERLNISGKWESKWSLPGVSKVTFSSINGPQFLDSLDNLVFPTVDLDTINLVPIKMTLNTTSYIPEVFTLNDQLIMQLADPNDLLTPKVEFKNGAVADGTRINPTSQSITVGNNSMLLATGVTDETACISFAANNNLDKYTLTDKNCYGSFTTLDKLPVERVLFADPKYTRVYGNYQLRINQEGDATKGGMNLLDINGTPRWTSHANVAVDTEGIYDDTNASRATILLKDSTDVTIWPPTLTNQQFDTDNLIIDQQAIDQTDIIIKNESGDIIIRFPTNGATPEYASINCRVT